MKQTEPDNIGIFDSGVGGLSVLRVIRKNLTQEKIIYFADQAHVPYGSRSLEEVRSYAISITRFLLEHKAKLIVIACNTASAAALHDLRRTFPGVPFVGMEPAVKPAAEATLTGVIGILATPATFQGALYASVIERFAGNATILQSTCPGLVEQIEMGDLSGIRTRQILAEALLPMIEKKVDSIVLGCTHYPFVVPAIRRIIGVDIRIIDPAPAITRQVIRLLPARKRGRSGQLTSYFTSGKSEDFKNIAESLIHSRGEYLEAFWDGHELKKSGQKP
jgi:glutamate racemase